MSAVIEVPRVLGAEQEYIDRVIAKHRGRPGELLGILEELQEHHPHKYLPPDLLAYLAERTAFQRAQIYSVATFFSLFNLRPQGEHTVCICRGTACHTRGSRSLLERAKLKLGLRREDEEGSADKLSVTTTDRRFTLRTVACFGQCALAPVVEIDHRILSHVNETVLEREMAALQKEGRA
jgi:NADH-quinone oxidoreductase subunit E